MSMRRTPQAFIKVKKGIQEILDLFDTTKNDKLIIRQDHKEQADHEEETENKQS